MGTCSNWGTKPEELNAKLSNDIPIRESSINPAAEFMDSTYYTSVVELTIYLDLRAMETPQVPDSNSSSMLNTVTGTLDRSNKYNRTRETIDKVNFVVAYIFDSDDGLWIELGRTEAITNSNDIEFLCPIRATYAFQELQKVKLEIYDFHEIRVSARKFSSFEEDLTKYKPLEIIETTLGSIFGCKGHKWECPLSSSPLCIITILGEEILNSHISMVLLDFSCEDLIFNLPKRTNKLISINPYLKLFKQLDDGEFVMTYKSEIRPSEEKPHFAEIEASALHFANSDLDHILKIEVWNYGGFGLHELIGEVETTLNELQQTAEENQRMNEREIQLELHQLRTSTRTRTLSFKRTKSKLEKEESKQRLGMTVRHPAQKYNKMYHGSGTLYINKFCIKEKPSFLDYIRGGAKVSFIVAIDFTVSNGDPRFPESLHYYDPTLAELHRRKQEELNAKSDKKSLSEGDLIRRILLEHSKQKDLDKDKDNDMEFFDTRIPDERGNMDERRDDSETDMSSLTEASHTHANDYVKAINGIGEVMEFYDTDKMFPVLGFGAKRPGEEASHCFPVTGNDNVVEAKGVTGILSAYYDTLKRIRFSGPTHFAPVIQRAIDIAKSDMVSQESQKYYVLLILTDGVLEDMEKTINSIIDATYVGLSILIIGIGKANFDMMKKLDADKDKLKNKFGNAANRDIVQFVAMRDFTDASGKLIQSKFVNAVLEEIPIQFVEYFEILGIEPNVPMAKRQSKILQRRRSSATSRPSMWEGRPADGPQDSGHVSQVSRVMTGEEEDDDVNSGRRPASRALSRKSRRVRSTEFLKRPKSLKPQF